MNAFLWTMTILGLIEVGSSMAYLITGKVPERTAPGVAINCICWAAVAYWAISLIGGQK